MKTSNRRPQKRNRFLVKDTHWEGNDLLAQWFRNVQSNFLYHYFSPTPTINDGATSIAAATPIPSAADNDTNEKL